MEMFQKAAGFKMTHIPSTGSGPAVTALLGGHVDAVSAPMQAIAPHLRSGQLRVLVFSHTQKVEEFPNVPTLTELGYNITSAGYNCLVGPKGMPEDVVQTLIRASDYVMTTHKKDMEEHFKRQFSDPGYLTGEELGKALRADWEITKQIIEELQKSEK
jgi:tripartite-type tricarboxylate transporter receptor subunit TctC